MTESHIQQDILAAWGAHPALRMWRANTGKVKMGNRWVQFGVPGQADISGVLLPHGRRLEIEVKTATGRQREEQKRWEAMITRFGGLYLLARSVADVDRAFASLGLTRFPIP